MRPVRAVGSHNPQTGEPKPGADNVASAFVEADSYATAEACVKNPYSKRLYRGSLNESIPEGVVDGAAGVVIAP